MLLLIASDMVNRIPILGLMKCMADGDLYTLPSVGD